MYANSSGVWWMSEFEWDEMHRKKLVNFRSLDLNFVRLCLDLLF